MNQSLLSAAVVTAGLLVSAQASANDISSLQGYYKSKASIKYTQQKVEQNKIDFVILDYALKNSAASNTPVTLPSLETVLASLTVSDEQKQQMTALYNSLNPEQESKACIVEKDSAKIIYLADDEASNCNALPQQSFKAMSLGPGRSSRYEVLSFFRAYGEAQSEGSQYYIEKLEKDSDGSLAIQSTFLLRQNNELIGDVTRVDRNNSGSYLIENYADYGKPAGDKIGYRSFQWTPAPIRENSAAIINSFAYLYGDQLSLNNKATPYYWAIKESVTGHTLRSGKQVYLSQHVERRQVSTQDASNFVKDNYSAASRSDWLAYNFNNANNLNGLSPDECMIYSIRNNEPVIRFKGYNRSLSDCNTEPEGYEKETLSELTSDNNQKIATTNSELVNSAANLIEVVEASSDTANSKIEITQQAYDAMKVQYDRAVTEYQNFTSLEFWK